MSALANLQGMFAPSNQEWPQLPLEEHTPNGLNFSFLPKGQDPIVFDEVDCAAGSWEEKAIFNSSEFKKVENGTYLRVLARFAYRRNWPMLLSWIGLEKCPAFRTCSFASFTTFMTR